MAKVAIRFTRPPGTATATFRLAEIEARTAMLRHWHATYVPGHFKLSANRRYGYQPRSGDNEGPKIPRADGKPGTRNNPHYSWVKRRKFGHNRPLVYTGESEREAVNPTYFAVRLMSPGRSRGVFTTIPEYWYRYHKGGVYFRRQASGIPLAVVIKPQPNKAEELTRMTADEVADMAKVGQQRITEFVQRYRPPASGVA